MSEPSGMDIVQRAAWEQWLEYERRQRMGTTTTERLERLPYFKGSTAMNEADTMSGKRNSMWYIGERKRDNSIFGAGGTRVFHAEYEVRSPEGELIAVVSDEAVELLEYIRKRAVKETP